MQRCPCPITNCVAVGCLLNRCTFAYLFEQLLLDFFLLTLIQCMIDWVPSSHNLQVKVEMLLDLLLEAVLLDKNSLAEGASETADIVRIHTVVEVIKRTPISFCA